MFFYKSRAHYNLARVTLELDQGKKSIEHYKQALEINPDFLMALVDLSWLLATHPNPDVRDSETALQLAKRVLSLTSKHNPESLDLFAAACAADDRFEQAIETAKRALNLATKRRMTPLSNRIRMRLGYYRDQKPYIEHANNSDAF